MAGSFITVIAAVIGVAGLVPVINAQQFCADFKNDSNSIPQLAPQFSFRVEANFVEHNRTLIVHEVFDSVNNRGALFSRRNGTGNRLIFDYDDNEIFFLSGYGPDQTCFVQSFLQAPRFVTGAFGFIQMNGSFHIGTASGFLLQIQNFPPTTFMGDDVVRGIPVSRWQACFDLPNMTYTADYYYSRNTWNYAATSGLDSYDTIPILVVVNGTEIEDDGEEDFYHVYSIYDYHTGPDSAHDRQFQVPNGQVCRGRIPGRPVPSVPDVFSATFQYTFSTNMPSNRVTTVREFYHMQHNLYRIDAYYDGAQGGSASVINLIHDFNTQTEYIVNRHTSTCRTSRIGTNNLVSFDVVDEEEGRTSLMTSRDLFFLQDRYNYTYEGVTTMRGVQVDSWLSVRDFESFSATSNLTNGVVELFFTRPEYTLTSVFSTNESVVPWAVKIRGIYSYINGTNGSVVSTNFTMEVDVVDFSTREPTYDAFDVSLCFEDSDVHTLIMVFDVGLMGLDLGELRTNLRTSIRRLTNLQPLQINNIQLLRGNDSTVIVSVHLANLSSSAQLSEGQQLVTAHEAFTTLTMTGPNGSLPFTVLVNGTVLTPRLLRFGSGRNTTVIVPTQNCTMNDTNNCDICNNTTIVVPTQNCTMSDIVKNNTNNCDDSMSNRNRTIVIYQNCTMNNSTKNNTSNCENNITNRLGLTDGVVAGIAVGLFFGGLIIGLLVNFFIICLCKCMCSGSGSFDVKKSSSVKYKRHDDELENIS